MKGEETKILNRTRRDRIDIIAEILLFCNHHKVKTEIMRSVNLKHAQIPNHLTYLTSLELLQNEEGRYLTTQK